MAFAVASASIFMFVLDAGLLSIALPEIESAFPESARATVSWASTGYLVSVAGLMLVSGRLGDVYGRKRVFEIGLAILVVGSLASGLAPNVALLVAGRMVQGIGGALVTATSLTLVLMDIPSHRRPLAIGFWGSTGSAAAVAGPVLGAEILDATNWRVVLMLIAPLAAMTFLAGRTLLRESYDATAPKQIDPPSVVLATVGIGALALGLSQSGRWGWTGVRTWFALGVGCVAFAAFVDRSRRHANPVLKPSLFANASYTGATISAGLQQLGFFSWFFSTSFVLREIWGWSVRDTGQAIALTFVFSAVTGWLGGRAATAFGYFWPTVVGALIAAAGPLYWFFAFDADPSFWTVYLPGAALFGIGGGSCGILTTGMALRTVPDADQGMAYAAHQTLRRMSSSIGLALMATLLGEASGAELLGGGRNVWLMVAAVHLLMIVPLLPSRRPPS